MSFNSQPSIVKPSDIFSTIKAILVVTSIQSPSIQDAERRRDELESLCSTADIKTVAWEYVKIREINPATYIGKGQVARLGCLAGEKEANLIVFNEGISPRVQRNIEEESGICTVDRQEIILQIFANRATTREARLQVELAQLEYSMPRLTRKWANLSQQRGGVKGSKGSGEKKLELDRRTASERRQKLKKEIAEISKQRSIQRRNRSIGEVKNVAIVGYTNSGKSTFLNRIASANVLSEDKLFATLDTTTRRVHLPNGETALFTDTVGFVSDLPHELVDAFKSTLEEACLADLLLVFLEAQRDDLEICYEAVESTLKTIGASDLPKIIVLNKMDLVEDPDGNFILQSFMSKHPNCICSSIKESTDSILCHLGSFLFDTVE